MSRVGSYPSHKAKHQDGGVDEPSVAALSGLLADDQHVLDAEVTAVAIPLTQKAAASGVASLSAASLVVQKPADRLSKANFEITANKLLKGAGAGADPTEIDVPSAKSIATGSYTGDGTNGRQITVGFQCSLVIIQCAWQARRLTMIPNLTVEDSDTTDNADRTAVAYLHASNGFVVDTATSGSNINGKTYYYWAISI